MVPFTGTDMYSDQLPIRFNWLQIDYKSAHRCIKTSIWAMNVKPFDHHSHSLLEVSGTEELYTVRQMWDQQITCTSRGSTGDLPIFNFRVTYFLSTRIMVHSQTTTKKSKPSLSLTICKTYNQLPTPRTQTVQMKSHLCSINWTKRSQ